MNRKRLLQAFCFAVSLSISAAGQDWTRFRGPDGAGISHAKTIPAQWSDTDINWKVELPGGGHSSPVIWGKRIFLTSSGGAAGGIKVFCLEAENGKILWKKEFPLMPFSKHRFNSFASSTPALDGERVYLSWGTPARYTLAALDHEGELVWERDLGPFESEHGPGTSPIVYEDKVVLGNEQDGESFIIAVDARTGDTIWKTKRRSSVVAYSTPAVYRPAEGDPALIFNSQSHGIYAVHPETGEVLWEYDQAFDKRSVSSPVISGNVIFGSCGAGGGGNFVTAIRAGDRRNGREPELLYQIKRSAPYVPTSVAYDGLVWLWSDGGILTCINAENGEVYFQERVGGNFFGSPIWIEGRLFCVSTSGEVVVAEAGPEFKVLARNPLNELCHATPAVAGGRLYIRTETNLWSIGGAQ
jgi:outer membrane protein assembly factor BamB